MFSLLQHSLLRHSCRALCNVGRHAPITYRVVFPSLHPSYISTRKVLSRRYSKEKSNDDNGESHNADSDSASPDSNNSPAPSRLSNSALVLPEAKLPSYAPMLAYHRIYMPGTATPFDPYAQMKDGEYIALFLSKKNPIYPITSILTEQKKAKSDTKSIWDVSAPESMWDIVSAEEQQTTEAAEHTTEPESTELEKTAPPSPHEPTEAPKISEAPNTLAAPDTTESPPTIADNDTTETRETDTTAMDTTTTDTAATDTTATHTTATGTTTTDTTAADTTAVDTTAADTTAADTTATTDTTASDTTSSDATATEGTETEPTDPSTKSSNILSDSKSDTSDAQSSDQQSKTTSTSEKLADAKETSKVAAEGDKSPSTTSAGLLQKKQAESNGAVIDSTAVYDVGVLAVVDKQSVASPRLRFLLPVRLCGTARPNMGAKIEPHKSDPYDSQEVDELMIKVKAALGKAMVASPSSLKVNTSESLLKQKDPNRFVFGLMAEYPSYLAEAQAVLSATSVPYRLTIALAVVETDMAIRRKQQEITKALDERTTKDQREFFLREQLKMVRKELGERDEKEELIEKYRARLTGEVPKEAMKVIDDELAKLQMLEPSSSEYGITRNYLDWLTILPWGVHSKESFDLKHAREVLEAEHYGLKDIKSRILEFIAVGSLKGSVQGKIICLVGPPGTGKTSIGKSIANALGRKFYRFSVGGMHDVSEIKGHRRTYVGAMPGKLLQCLKQVKVANPVILIDEIDKLGRGRQGDPASALLEVLDPEQNATFMDHYLDVPVDLSKVLFICTANVRDTIPKPLLDRMEVMYLSGYIPEEQVQIVKRYLIPAAVKAAGLKPEQIQIEDSAVQVLVKSYCREAGVRNLQKHVEKIARKVALKRVRGTRSSSTVTGDNLGVYVGKPVFSSDRYYQQTPSGIVMGLAWTQMGGAALYVETVQDPLLTRPEMRITGQLGDVMKESTSISYTYAKNYLEQVLQGNRFFEGASLHMHIPEGATPKDGPSAGITMVTSLISLALNKPVLNNLAMTGEITLTGKVLPIGGVREKCIASKRAGVTRVILPIGNKKDWTDLPLNIKKGLIAYFADYYKDVYVIAFADPTSVPVPDPTLQYNYKPRTKPTTKHTKTSSRSTRPPTKKVARSPVKSTTKPTKHTKSSSSTTSSPKRNPTRPTKPTKLTKSTKPKPTKLKPTTPKPTTKKGASVTSRGTTTTTKSKLGKRRKTTLKSKTTPKTTTPTKRKVV